MPTIRHLISFSLMFSCYLVGNIFYRIKVQWINRSQPCWDHISLLIFINHTSLFEPIFTGAFPLKLIWKTARNFAIPGADKTLNRPLVGRFYKFFSPNMVSISRKRDETWKKFMEISAESPMIIIAPEGRMKRPNGLDANGNPMSIRGGVVDILKNINSGNILFAYSGGLHHVQKPGENKFSIFRTIKMNFELIDLNSYKNQFSKDHKEFYLQVISDIENRKKMHIPT